MGHGSAKFDDFQLRMKAQVLKTESDWTKKQFWPPGHLDREIVERGLRNLGSVVLQLLLMLAEPFEMSCHESFERSVDPGLVTKVKDAIVGFAVLSKTIV